jgi:hypothetical protein
MPNPPELQLPVEVACPAADAVGLTAEAFAPPVAAQLNGG